MPSPECSNTTVNTQTWISLWLKFVAAGDPNPTPTGIPANPVPEIDPDRVTPGVWGFLSFVILIVAATILYFSMRKQLRKVDFDEDSSEAGGDEAPHVDVRSTDSAR